jgi:hypothetical protein
LTSGSGPKEKAGRTGAAWTVAAAPLGMVETSGMPTLATWVTARLSDWAGAAACRGVSASAATEMKLEIATALIIRIVFMMYLL